MVTLPLLGCLLLVFGAIGATTAAIWAALRTGHEADKAYMASMGCTCPAGIDGFHLRGCPLDRDDTDTAGA